MCVYLPDSDEFERAPCSEFESVLRVEKRFILNRFKWLIILFEFEYLIEGRIEGRIETGA